MKHDLEQVRNWARDRLQSGAVPEWSWDQHVKLIEAVDAILHDMAILTQPSDVDTPAAHCLRLVDNMQKQTHQARKAALPTHGWSGDSRPSRAKTHRFH